MTRHPGYSLFLALLLALSCAKPKAKDDSTTPPDDEQKKQETHGGDRLASIFVAKGYIVFLHLKKLPEADRPVTLDEMIAFDAALRTTRIDPVLGPLVDSAGDQVDARTLDDPLYPGQKLIELDRDQWEKHFADDTDVYRLVFHEYLWVIGADDTNYRISNRLNLDQVEDKGVGSWKEMNSRGAPTIDPAQRDETRAVYANGAAYVFPAAPSADCSVPVVGHAYDVGMDSWKALTPPPLTQTNGFGVATAGLNVVVWGGSCRNPETSAPEYPAAGAIYSTATGVWDEMATANAPEGRRAAVVASRDNRVVVWGGIGPLGAVSTGAVYDGATGTWKAMTTTGAPPAGPYQGVLTVSGIASSIADKFLVWPKDRETCNAPIYTYDLAADTWATITPASAPAYPCRWRDAVWTEERLIFTFDYPQVDAGGKAIAGVFWDPGFQSWKEISAIAAPSYRSHASVLWIDDRIHVFGGWDIDDLPTNDGGIYNKIAETWQPLRTTDAPSARAKPFSVWTGDRAIVWGGISITGMPLKSGAIWIPAQ